ncbi:MAG TPA: Sec-independent protein translocase protein TatB [Usitatibacter sp.]|nr:Sec-independent protein translocase protein TatB [Usitatibacter sp.]
MFDVGFSEMLVIAIVALVVIGPERLPRVARTAGILFGRLQRYVAQVKSDINREMEAAELGKVKSEFESAARSIKDDIETQAADAEREIRDVQASIDRELQDAAKAAGEPASAEPPAASPQLELGIEEPPPASPPPAPAAPGKPA